MNVREAMTTNVEYVLPGASLQEVAEKMAKLDCGFLPVSDPDGSRLAGVVTDRDICIRGVGAGLDPEVTPVKKIMSFELIYCYAEDTIEQAAELMRTERVYRLIVLNNETEKTLCGVISLGDILRQNREMLAGSVAKEIIANAA